MLMSNEQMPRSLHRFHALSTPLVVVVVVDLVVVLIVVGCGPFSQTAWIQGPSSSFSFFAPWVE